MRKLRNSRGARCENVACSVSLRNKNYAVIVCGLRNCLVNTAKVGFVGKAVSIGFVEGFLVGACWDLGHEEHFSERIKVDAFESPEIGLFLSDIWCELIITWSR